MGYVAGPQPFVMIGPRKQEACTLLLRFEKTFRHLAVFRRTACMNSGVVHLTGCRCCIYLWRRQPLMAIPNIEVNTKLPQIDVTLEEPVCAYL
jgi:hypothetical protein